MKKIFKILIFILTNLTIYNLYSTETIRIAPEGKFLQYYNTDVSTATATNYWVDNGTTLSPIGVRNIKITNKNIYNSAGVPAIVLDTTKTDFRTTPYSLNAITISVGATPTSAKVDMPYAILNLPQTVNANAGIITMQDIPFLHNFCLNVLKGNIFLGLNSGNFTMNSNAYGNSMFGDNSFRNNISGFQNSGFGMYALYNLTTGTNNSGFGYEALYNLTTGTNNSVLGYQSGKNLIDGSFNSFFGNFAGANALQKTDALNTIAIGENAYTTKDNQAVFGGTNITETVLRGNVLAENITIDEKINITSDGSDPNFDIYFQSKGTNGRTQLFTKPTGTSGTAFVGCINSSDTLNASSVKLGSRNNYGLVSIGKTGNPTRNLTKFGIEVDVSNSSPDDEVVFGYNGYIGGTPDASIKFRQLETGLTAFGSDFTPTAFVHTAPSTTSNSALRIENGINPSSINIGDIWSTANNNGELNFKKNATDIVNLALQVNGNAILEIGSLVTSPPQSYVFTALNSSTFVASNLKLINISAAGKGESQNSYSTDLKLYGLAKLSPTSGIDKDIELRFGKIKYARTPVTYNFSTDILTVPFAHNLNEDDIVKPRIVTDGILPAGLRDNVFYYVKYLTPTTFQLKYYPGPSPIIDFTTNGSGNQYYSLAYFIGGKDNKIIGSSGDGLSLQVYANSDFDFNDEFQLMAANATDSTSFITKHAYITVNN